MRVFTNSPQADWRTVGPFARAAENIGFDSLMTLELGHDAFMPLGFAALETTSIELTTSIAVAFPRSPTVLALQAWDIHANSNGRFVLGLGSQVKGHNERRFGIPWSPPAPRLGEYIEALRAIWKCWETRGKLNYEGQHYKLTLMTPDFSPEPTSLPMIPITVAAVGPAMLSIAGRLCDGVRLHPICSRKYLEEFCMPRMQAGLDKSGRKRENFDVHGGGFVCTGPDEESVAKAMEWARMRVAFYGSTRSYHPILAMHGLEETGIKLHQMSVDRRWKEMAAEIDDDALQVFAACGTYDKIAGEIEKRFGGVANTVEIYTSPDTDLAPFKEVLEDVHRIPHQFKGFDTAAV